MKTKKKHPNNCVFWQLATVPCLLNPGRRKPCWFFYVRVPWVQVCCLVIMVLVFLPGFWCTCLLIHHSSACLLFWWCQEAVGYKKSGTEGHCIPWALTIICSLHSRHLKTFLTGSTHHWKGFYKGTCVLKWEGTDVNPGLAASTSFPEPKGKSWAHRESQWCLVCTERGMGPEKGQASPGNTGEGRDDSVLLLNLVYCAEQPPRTYTWRRIGDGSCPWTLLLGESGVYCSVQRCPPRVSPALCTEVSGQTQSLGIDKSVSFHLHAGSNNGDRP